MTRLSKRLLAWYDSHRRILPWRDRDDPWGTWVSEIMLQQTRVETVLEPFERFMARYPTPADWAGVSDDELLQAWRGLGYYRRARLLRQGAQQVVAAHAGQVPNDPTALRALAGIGDYTVGAIASIAFGHPVAALDGNVERVFARHAGIAEDIKKSATRRQLRDHVLEHMDPKRAGDFNQALMDLGASLCTPRKPSCGDCPIAIGCTAKREGTQGELPRLPARRAFVDVFPQVVIIQQSNGLVLAARIPKGEINEGQVELPGTGILMSLAEGQDFAAQVHQRHGHGIDVQIGTRLGEVRHSVTHHRIRLAVHLGRLASRVRGNLKAYAADDPEVPWTTASRKALALLGNKSQENTS